MIVSDQQRDENFQEYLRLLNDPNYYNVTFDEKSGGVSAIHKDHQFDKKIGPFGIKRGAYEHTAITILRNNGYMVTLASEKTEVGSKQCDGFVYYSSMEIKTVEGEGRWAIRTKIYDAAKQGADVVVLLFPNKNLYNLERVLEGWKMYEEVRIRNIDWPSISSIMVIVEQNLIEIEKPSW